jgi:excinuclease UvrABC ATPase subunit
MPKEYIEIRGARENNLKDVSLRLPKRKITVFTGVSGSGKSSLVFDTLAAEAQRRLYENFSLFVRTFLPHYPQPDVDALENLSLAVIVDQKRLGGASPSTVGTITDIAPLLRLLFSRGGQPYVGYANAFSFNDVAGMCPACNGVGRTMGVKVEALVDKTKSLNEGAIIAPGFSDWDRNNYARGNEFDNDKKLAAYTPDEMQRLLYGEAHTFKISGQAGLKLAGGGVVVRFNRKFMSRDIKTLSPRVRKMVEPLLEMAVCPVCHGARLSQAALGCRINGHNIAELSALEVNELIAAVKAIRAPALAPIVAALVERLQSLVDIGLEYLSLDRPTDTLSGGESQRVKIVKHLTSGLMDAMYIFDEPSIGLHPRDIHRMNELLQALRDKGNTVLVVEHDPAVMAVADHVVDLGPRAGSDGGQIVYEGSFAGLAKARTLTAQFLTRDLAPKTAVRPARGQLPIRHAMVNNLKDVSVDIPTGVLTVVTGVAGSGKSSLILQAFLAQHPDAVVVDQSALSASSRSNPATYTGIMDELRKAFATANKVEPGLFSFNSKGACESCQGLGVTYLDVAFLDAVAVPCEACQGRRFKDEVLAYRLDGKSIADVLDMTIRQALVFFQRPGLSVKLQALSDVGLDYLTLGQPLSTLSGGECQRIKLASELHQAGSVYVLDEPTTGLHMSDIARLLEVLNRLVDTGNTVIVIEHNHDVICSADWIIDLGPEGGNKGGRVVFEGTPQQLLRAKNSLTGKYLRG